MIAHLIRLYRATDRIAAHAYVIGDETEMEHALDARNSIAAILHTRDRAAWRRARALRFEPALAAGTIPTP
jgi:hypothetical protein